MPSVITAVITLRLFKMPSNLPQHGYCSYLRTHRTLLQLSLPGGKLKAFRRKREQLSRLHDNYRYSGRERTRARILLLAEAGESDTAVAASVGCHWMIVRNVRLRFCTKQKNVFQEAIEPLELTQETIKGLVKYTEHKKRARRAFDGEQEAHLIALAYSTPPDGENHWTLQLLQARLIEGQVVENVGKETIRRTMKKRP